MAKIRGINQKAKYKALNKRLVGYLPLVQSVYDKTCKKAARLALLTSYDGEELFRFNDFTEIKSAVTRLMSDFRTDLEATIVAITSKEWAQSNVVQDMLADKVLKSYTHTIDRQRYKSYYQPNNAAYKAFIKRFEGGHTLSGRIWNESFEVRKELEAALSVGIEKGMDAVTLSKRLSKYLNDYPKLQKDYKEKYGKSASIENCEYRSMRLARSETNMAYRTAEQLRWRQMDFVLGYEIKISGSHDEDDHDVCDELQGRYPKDFEWTGWHPNCMCYEIPILMTEEQFAGNEKADPVDDVPDNFKEYIAENADKIEAAKARGTEPYFVRDNEDYVDEILSQEEEQHWPSKGIST
jgi:hypothetical protein